MRVWTITKSERVVLVAKTPEEAVEIAQKSFAGELSAADIKHQLDMGVEGFAPMVVSLEAKAGNHE